MGEDSEQFDMFDSGDREQRARVLARKAADEYGIPELATKHRLDERTLRNQLDRRKREDKTGGSHWKLSEDTLWTLLLDKTHVGRRFRGKLLALCDEEIADIEAVEPEDALRDMQAMALAGEFGNAGREKVITLIRRVKRGRR